MNDKKSLFEESIEFVAMILVTMLIIAVIIGFVFIFTATESPIEQSNEHIDNHVVLNENIDSQTLQVKIGKTVDTEYYYLDTPNSSYKFEAESGQMHRISEGFGEYTMYVVKDGGYIEIDDITITEREEHEPEEPEVTQNSTIVEDK